MSVVDRRTALLDAAVAEIARSGTRGLRVEAVAKTAGVSTALIYHHFGDRSTLLLNALRHIGAKADGYARPHGGTGRDMVVRMLLGEIQGEPLVRVNSAAWGELRGEATFDASLQPLLAQLTQDWADEVAALILTGHNDGSILKGQDANDLAVQLTAMVEGVSGRWLTDQLTTTQARAHVLAAATALLGSETTS